MKNNKLKKLIEKFSEVYYVEGTPAHIKLILATVISTFVPGNPIWLMIVGGSSSGKTVALNIVGDFKSPITKKDIIYPISNISSNAFLSAIKVKDGMENPSLLHRIGNYGVLVFKDFTSILSQRPDEKFAVLSQLREIFDGALTKNTGMGKTLSWKGKITFLGAVTSKYFEHARDIDSMGPRFLLYQFKDLDIDGRMKLLDYVQRNVFDIEKKQRELRDMASELLKDYVENLPAKLEVVPDETFYVLKSLAELTARARTPVAKSWDNKITMVHDKESPARLIGQVLKLAMILQYMNGGELTEDDKASLYKILLDSIPKQKRDILFTMSSLDTVPTSVVSEIVNLPTSSVRDILDELHAHGILIRTSPAVGANNWSLNKRDKATLSKVLNSKSDVLYHDMRDVDEIETVHTSIVHTTEVDDPIAVEEALQNEFDAF